VRFPGIAVQAAGAGMPGADGRHRIACNARVRGANPPYEFPALSGLSFLPGMAAGPGWRETAKAANERETLFLIGCEPIKA
jgi:hypothetical protein